MTVKEWIGANLVRVDGASVSFEQLYAVLVAALGTRPGKDEVAAALRELGAVPGPKRLRPRVWLGVRMKTSADAKLDEARAARDAAQAAYSAASAEQVASAGLVSRAREHELADRSTELGVELRAAERQVEHARADVERVVAERAAPKSSAEKPKSITIVKTGAWAQAGPRERLEALERLRERVVKRIEECKRANARARFDSQIDHEELRGLRQALAEIDVELKELREEVAAEREPDPAVRRAQAELELESALEEDARLVDEMRVLREADLYEGGQYAPHRATRREWAEEHRQKLGRRIELSREIEAARKRVAELSAEAAARKARAAA